MESHPQNPHIISRALNAPATILGLDVRYFLASLVCGAVTGKRLVGHSIPGAIALFAALLIAAFYAAQKHPWLPVFLLSQRHRATYYCPLKRTY